MLMSILRRKRISTSPNTEKIIDGINAFIDSKQEEQEGQKNDNINESTTIPKESSNTGISAVI